MDQQDLQIYVPAEYWRRQMLSLEQGIVAEHKPLRRNLS